MDDQARPPELERPFLPAPDSTGASPLPSAGRPSDADAEAPPPAVARRGRERVDAVRPYLLTAGRVRPLDETLAIEAQVMATAAGRAQWPRLAFEHRDIVALCAEPVAIAEVAARLGLHTGVTRVLVGDLAALGYLTVLRPAAGLGRDVEIIERVIRGLEAIR